MHDGYRYARCYISSYSVTNNDFASYFVPPIFIPNPHLYLTPNNHSINMDEASVPVYCVYPLSDRAVDASATYRIRILPAAKLSFR